MITGSINFECTCHNENISKKCCLSGLGRVLLIKQTYLFFNWHQILTSITKQRTLCRNINVLYKSPCTFWTICYTVKYSSCKLIKNLYTNLKFFLDKPQYTGIIHTIRRNLIMVDITIYQNISKKLNCIVVVYIDQLLGASHQGLAWLTIMKKSKKVLQNQVVTKANTFFFVSWIAVA